MFGVPGYWAFLVGAILIILLPGPNSMYVLTTAAKHGVGRGYRAAVGVVIGDSVLMLASVAGVSSLLRANPALFGVVKYAGAAYLCWLGIKLVIGGVAKARGRLAADEPGAGVVATAAEPTAAEPASTRRRGRALHSLRLPRRGPLATALVLCLLNPKSILFYVAFFAQFIDPAATHPVESFLVLAVTLQIVSVVYLSALIFGGSFLAERFRRHRRTAGTATAVTGLAFVGFSAKLATASLG